jgi:hypothetical protein
VLDVRCPKCRESRSAARLGNALSTAWRRLFRRNLYVCHACAVYWRSPLFESRLPRTSVRIRRP